MFQRSLFTASAVLLLACAAQSRANPAAPEPAEPSPAVAAPESSDGGAEQAPVAQADAPETDADRAAVAAWNTVVGRYVTDDGGFRYAALLEDSEARAELDAFLAWAADADTDGWSRARELAFLVNAYNAATVSSVLHSWPVESVLAEPGFFDADKHTIAGAELTLNELENDRIRARFGEPRIHFVVNCASAGCPWLVPFALTADNLEATLEAQTRAFLDRTVRVEDGTVWLSQIFEWFAGDFESAGGVRAFVAAHLDDQRAADVSDETNAIAFTPYDWASNARD